MEKFQCGPLSEVIYETFIIYFENDYLKELTSKNTFEVRESFLKAARQIAENHRQIYEARHGQGSYGANLAKYGNLKRTPLQIITGHLHLTHLLYPKKAHTYSTILW